MLWFSLPLGLPLLLYSLIDLCIVLPGYLVRDLFSGSLRLSICLPALLSGFVFHYGLVSTLLLTDLSDSPVISREFYLEALEEYIGSRPAALFPPPTIVVHTVDARLAAIARMRTYLRRRRGVCPVGEIAGRPRSSVHTCMVQNIT